MSVVNPYALALEEAVRANRPEQVRALLTRGLSVDTPLPNDKTPLTLALSLSHWSLAEELLERGADPSQKVNGYYHCLTWAGSFGQRALVEKLLARISHEEKDGMGYTPVAWAVRFGLAEMVKRRLDQGASTDSRDQVGNSLLHIAATQDNPAVVEMLLRARPELGQAVNNYQKQTALHIAASRPTADNRAVVEAMLAAGMSPEQKDHLGLTPVVLAAAHSRPAVLQAMLTRRGRPLSPEERLQALKFAIMAGRTEQVCRLMAEFDYSYPLEEDHPLRVAISYSRWDLVELVLKHGINPDTRLPKDGPALLPWSMQQFRPELARILLAMGATSQRERAMRWLDNVMLMRKSSVVWLQPGSRSQDQPANAELLVALQKNIEKLGFMLTPELAERVLTLTHEELRDFYQQLVACLRALVGADKPFRPMYPNFPDQVRDASPIELYLNAIAHYWGDVIGRRIMPSYQKDPRAPLQDRPALRPVGLARPEEPAGIFAQLLASRGSLMGEDKEILDWYVYSRGDALAAELPAELPFRENAALLAAALLRYTYLHEQARTYVKNGVDVLRVATAYSRGDVSLANATRFVSFSKSLRRWMLGALETDSELDESLWRHPEKFKRLAERLHPGEYRQRFPRTWEAFRRLRAGSKPTTFASQVEGHLAQAEVTACLPLLRSRPGDFARRLDHLLRLSSPVQVKEVVEAFAQVVKRLPSPLLLQLRHHFQSRPTDHPFRVVFPKGEVGKIRAVEPPPLSLDASLCSRMETLCQEALLALYAQRPSLGPCWLDDQLKRYTVPFALRSASKALRTVARGSRLPFCAPGEAVGPRETMRFFIWWRDGKSRTDLDLSALVLDDDFQFQTDLAYYNLKELGGYHSGDITSAPEGASEFIDIEIDTFAGRGARYVMMVVNSFTTQPYCDLPECFAGFMRRNAPQSGEVYEPRTLIHKFDLTANSTIAIPLILDLREREVIWTDLSLKRNPSRVNNVRGNRSSLSLLCEAMVNLSRPSLHDLFGLHVLARGQAAGDPEQAQTRFQAEPAPGVITPYDIPLIMAEYL